MGPIIRQITLIPFRPIVTSAYDSFSHYSTFDSQLQVGQRGKGILEIAPQIGIAF